MVFGKAEENTDAHPDDRGDQQRYAQAEQIEEDRLSEKTAPHEASSPLRLGRLAQERKGSHGRAVVQRRVGEWVNT